jgi:polyhydroxybutyrate depolymerase
MVGGRAIFAALFAIAASACGDERLAQGTAGSMAQAGGGIAGSSGTGGVRASGGAGGSGGGAARTAGTGGADGGASAAGIGGSAGAAGTAGAGSGADAGSAQDDCPDAPALAAGMKTQMLEVDGAARSYLVVVPASLDARTRAPVVLGFHGGSGTAEAAHQSYGLAAEEAALYVYPQAISWPEAGGVAWNVDPAGHDLPYFDALLADLAERYCIDPARVFAAGQSNGGFFVNALGCYRPDALRAIASAAGGGPPGQCTKGVAAMIIHGSADTTVTLDKGMYSRDYWLAANDCTDAASLPVDPAPCVSYADCTAPVLWCEHAGGHPWPDFAGPAIRAFFLGL